MEFANQAFAMVEIQDKKNLQLICCPIGSPKTEFGVGRANLNLATLWLSSVLLTSLYSLKFSGSKQPIKTWQGINQFAQILIYIHKALSFDSIAKITNSAFTNHKKLRLLVILDNPQSQQMDSSLFAPKLIKQLINLKTWAFLTHNN
jgi:hypothetical protein